MATIGSILLNRLKKKGAGRLVSELRDGEEGGQDTTVSIAGEDPIRARREELKARRLSDFAGPNGPEDPGSVAMRGDLAGPKDNRVGEAIIGPFPDRVGRVQIGSAPPQQTGVPASAGAPDQEFVRGLEAVGLEAPQAAALARASQTGARTATPAEGLGDGPLLGPEDQALLDQTGAPPQAQGPQRREPIAQMSSPDPFTMAREKLAMSQGQTGARIRQLRDGGLSQGEAIAQAADEGLIEPRLARRMLGIAQAGR